MPVLQEFKCPCCDGAIEFDSGSQKMKCPFCDTEFDVETLVSYNEELVQDQEDVMRWEAPVVLSNCCAACTVTCASGSVCCQMERKYSSTPS